ncbi:MAG: metal-dependent hydrolase, partial [Gammaproteobacteria bacterium]|nr:metal-dependent hydrolase [Gammaproteobacteria bacterium]
MPAARTNRAHAASTDHHPAANAIRSATPAGMIPKVRRPDFIFPDDAPQWWWGHDPFRTLLLAALSAGFPPGERFFIDSVR